MITAKKLNILQVGPGKLPIPPNGWGGIEKVIWKWTENLRNNGHDVEIFNQPKINPVIDKIKNNQYDVVHLHMDQHAQLFINHKMPFYFTSHHASWQKKWNSFLKILKNKFCTPLLFKMMYNKYQKHNTGECWMIENGADDNIFYPEKKIKNKIIAIGKNEPRKKFGQIAKMIKQKSDYELNIIGPNNSEHKIAKNIKIYPNLKEEEVAKMCRSADFFVHLSDLEADCLAVKEAAMSGCKLILSDYCAKTIGEEVSWKRLEDLENCPSDLGEQARKKSLSQFSWHHIIKKLENIYLRKT